jgi:hypothetical protein
MTRLPEPIVDWRFCKDQLLGRGEHRGAGATLMLIRIAPQIAIYCLRR